MDNLTIYVIEKCEGLDSSSATESIPSAFFVDNDNPDSFKSWNDLINEHLEAFYAQGNHVQRGLKYDGKLYDIARSVRPNQNPTVYIHESEFFKDENKQISPEKKDVRNEQHSRKLSESQLPQKKFVAQVNSVVAAANPTADKEMQLKKPENRLKTKRQHQAQKVIGKQLKRPRFHLVPKISQAHDKIDRSEKATEKPKSENAVQIKCRHCDMLLATRAQRRRHEMALHRSQPVHTSLLDPRLKDGEVNFLKSTPNESMIVNDRFCAVEDVIVQQQNPDSKSNNQVACLHCSETFSWEPSLLKHIKMTHPTQQRDDNNDGNESPVF